MKEIQDVTVKMFEGLGDDGQLLWTSVRSKYDPEIKTIDGMTDEQVAQYHDYVKNLPTGITHPITQKTMVLRDVDFVIRWMPNDVSGIIYMDVNAAYSTMDNEDGDRIVIHHYLGNTPKFK
jgi:hypothetical protein